MKKRLLSLVLCVLSSCFWPAPAAWAQDLVSATASKDAFGITAASMPAIFVDTQDSWLVQKAAALLQKDILAVTGKQPALVHDLDKAGSHPIIIGSLIGCPLIGQLAASHQLSLEDLHGQWEAFQLQTIDHIRPGINKALVITGSDKRGTAYGVFTLSAALGVSPWYWWADVPVRPQRSVYIKGGRHFYKSPAVKYRGIFINDEAPAFSGWTREKFGGVNHLVYEKIFELLLRLKGNYLWPAMWGNAFNDDDSLNPILADQWGIVMGTSHHEPMLRAQTEWKRYGKGPWDYTRNEQVLKDFWTTGIRHMGQHESIVTIGMRGDGDMPMTQGTATALLEKIVQDQRGIISSITGQPASATPQLWALYKEVQDYYDQGMRVPDDVTLLLCDDNWGNIRRLPTPGSPHRQGGYGIYYHFDYVGGPRNYKWINTNNISRVWEQMHLAYAHGVDRIWIVNVGDLKPMELPISFFLDYACDPSKWEAHNLPDYYQQWAAQQFGDTYAARIGNILRQYAQYASRRKPELLDAHTYSLTHYQEFQRVINEWKNLRAKAEAINKTLPSSFKDAYFQLVLHPVQALENLHQLYYAVAMNQWLAAQKNTQANKWAQKAKDFYRADSLLSYQYNHETAQGKWNHMMDQTHIGYHSWQEPRVQSLPPLIYIGTDTVTATMQIPGETDRMPSKESSGYISIDVTRYSKAIGQPDLQWKLIPDIGKQGDGITSFPVTKGAVLSATSPHLVYTFHANRRDSVLLSAYTCPTLNIYHTATGLRYAVSLDDETPQVVELNKEDNTGIWNNWVANNAIVKTTRHFIAGPGRHILRYWLIDPGVVLQNLVVSYGALPPSYLAPPPATTRKK